MRFDPADPYYEGPELYAEPPRREPYRSPHDNPPDPPRPQVVMCFCGHYHDDELGAPALSGGKTYCLDCAAKFTNDLEGDDEA